MRIFTQKTLSIALAVGIGSLAADAVLRDPRDFDLTKLRYRVESSSVFRNDRSRTIEAANRFMFPTEANPMTRTENGEQPKPAWQFSGTGDLGDIDGLNGERWFFTADYVYTEIPPHGDVAFTDRILQEYTFHIYDADMKVVGTIKDKMRYASDEVRVPMCELTPVITRNFFNTDDKLEVIVGLAVNTSTPGLNHYRSIVYSIGGEKDSEGYDKVIYSMDNLVSDVAEGPSTGGSDNFYITFGSDIMPDDYDMENNFWEYLCSCKARFQIYGKAVDNKGPRLIFDKTIPLLQVPGDQESTPALISMNHGGDVYFAISEYKQPFYNRYDNPISDDMTQREDNTLAISMYKADGDKINLVSQTDIPVVRDLMADTDGNPTALFTYYGVGRLRYRGDFLFDSPTAKDGKPDFIITRSNYRHATDDLIDSYFIYSNDGRQLHTLAEYSSFSVAMGDIKGFEPQQLFLTQDAWGYVFKLVDLYSGKTAATIDCNYSYDDDSDAETLTTNIDRTPAGNSYKYVCELRYPVVDENENDIMRFIWINADASYDHIDQVNMGKGVAYAQSFISTDALAPHAYTVGDDPAYMMLVKRGVTETVNIEELLVASIISDENTEGKTLLSAGPDEKGSLSGIIPEFGDNGRLMIYRSGTNNVSLDIYRLPLDADDSGIDSVIGDNAGDLVIDGPMLKADGCITVYTLSGVTAASADGSVDLSSLTPGLYIATANGKAHKLLIK